MIAVAEIRTIKQCDIICILSRVSAEFDLCTLRTELPSLVPRPCPAVGVVSARDYLDDDGSSSRRPSNSPKASVSDFWSA